MAHLPKTPSDNLLDVSSFWDHPRQMEPLWPVDSSLSLWDKAVVLIREFCRVLLLPRPVSERPARHLDITFVSVETGSVR